jgi:ADP-ribose pyrophosphatase
VTRANDPGPEPWELISERPVYDGWLPVHVRQDRLPDGRECDWEVLKLGDIVSVLPITPEGRVVAVRMFRAGPDRVVTQLPGGFVDAGEEPAAAAARELTEETGYTCASVELAGWHWGWNSATPRRHIAIARGCRPNGAQRLDEFEDCVPVELTVPELRAMLRGNGLMTTVDAAYLALDHAGLL